MKDFKEFENLVMSSFEYTHMLENKVETLSNELENLKNSDNSKNIDRLTHFIETTFVSELYSPRIRFVNYSGLCAVCDGSGYSDIVRVGVFGKTVCSCFDDSPEYYTFAMKVVSISETDVVLLDSENGEFVKVSKNSIRQSFEDSDLNVTNFTNLYFVDKSDCDLFIEKKNNQEVN